MRAAVLPFLCVSQTCADTADAAAAAIGDAVWRWGEEDSVELAIERANEMPACVAAGKRRRVDAWLGGKVRRLNGRDAGWTLGQPDGLLRAHCGADGGHERPETGCW